MPPSYRTQGISVLFSGPNRSRMTKDRAERRARGSDLSVVVSDRFDRPYESYQPCATAPIRRENPARLAAPALTESVSCGEDPQLVHCGLRSGIVVEQAHVPLRVRSPVAKNGIVVGLVSQRPPVKARTSCLLRGRGRLHKEFPLMPR